MGSFSLMHWAIVLLLVLLLFGAGKLPKVMGDLAKGVKSFKAGLKDDESDAAPIFVEASRKPASEA
ncbi:twin-arginine translocase TatA/TatE family subunit [Azospirillum himalayense]|uniref:Sec-independent protein translocase protein TatA n=1 Tax=Azospirillum himalayense TaxID=654847 RepID=A0ABW0FYY5_9PROT